MRISTISLGLVLHLASSVLLAAESGPAVSFSRASGTFTQSFHLTLSTPDVPNTLIRYVVVTNPGSMTNLVTATSPAYTGPIYINGSAYVRARAFPSEPGDSPGPISAATYIQITSNAPNYSSDLPTVVIQGLGGYPTSYSYGIVYPAIMAVYDNASGPSSLANAPSVLTPISLQVGPNDETAGNPQSSFLLEIRNQTNQPLPIELLGMPADSEWMLLAPNFFDRGLIRHPLAFEISNQVGRYAPRSRFVEVFFNSSTSSPISANLNASGAAMGNYWGLYLLVEKIKQGKDRVDIQPLLPEHTNAPAITGGYMMKEDRPAIDDRSFAAGGRAMVWVYPTGLEMATPQRERQANYIRDHFNAFYAALTGPNPTNPLTGYPAYIDVGSWIDHHILNVLAMNSDGIRLKGYVYKDRNQKIAMGPIADSDRAFGAGDPLSMDYRSFNPRGFMGTTGFGMGSSDFGTDFFNGDSTWTNPWYSRLFRFPDFWQAWIDRYQELRQSVLSTNNLMALVDQLVEEVRRAQVREVARWSNSGASDVRPRAGLIQVAPSSRGPIGYSHTFDGTYPGEIAFQKRWLADHLEFLDTNFLKRPTLSHPDGNVVKYSKVLLTDTSGKTGTQIYYTLDGTDPRAPGGAVATNAQLYTRAIYVTENLRVTARAYNPNHYNLTGPGNPPISSPWSSPASVPFYTAIPSLRITELMYHPPPATPDSTNAVDLYEYLELKNTGSAALPLQGFRLRGGIEFTFPNLTLDAGASCVVVADPTAFQQRYGGGALIAGSYTGNLADAGEELILEGPMGEPILNFNYRKEWHPITAGLGFSLVINDEAAPMAAWGAQSNWRVSSAPNGSPGQSNPPAPQIPNVLINEVWAFTGHFPSTSFELYNPGYESVNLNGWSITDDLREPRKWPLPYNIPYSSIVLPPGSYTVISDGQFNPNGGEMYLFSGDGANLTGYLHRFAYGPLLSGASFGRYVTSTGDEHFVPQQTHTPGTNNAGPRSSPIAISELMYQPPALQALGRTYDNAADEYIELLNTSVAEQFLYDPVFPAATWQLAGAVNYVFPTNVSLPAGGYALVVSFDPANQASAAAFRERCQVPASVPLFGPYAGTLGNRSGTVQLLRPDKRFILEADTYVLTAPAIAEQVDYQNAPPWPAGANGLGPSLQRRVASAYANDPTNWVAAMPTPGAPYAGGEPPLITEQPQTQTVVGGTTARLRVTASGAQPFRYQWLCNGVPLLGATQAVLELPAVRLNQAGVYQVVVLNPAQAVASHQATLAVLPPVTITQPPRTWAVRPGTNVTFTVAASSARAIRYQWLFNGTNIAEATDNRLALANVQPEHDGFYQVLVADDISSALSDPVRLTVLVNPFIVSPPPHQVLRAGDTLQLTVQVTNTATLPITCRWRRNGNSIATNQVWSYRDTLCLSNLAVSDAGYFSVVVANEAFPTGILGPNTYATVVLPPADQAVTPGSEAVFHLTAGNPGPPNRPVTLLYHWQCNGTEIPGQAGNTLSLPNVQPAHVGTYAVTVTAVTNGPIAEATFTAHLSLAQDNDADGLPDAWELAHGLLPGDTADALADADSDGLTNLAEYKAGTDPRDPLSYLKVELATPSGQGLTNVTLRFAAVSNKTYSVQYRTTWDPAALWSNLQQVAAATTNRTIEIIDSTATAPARYYRLVTPRQ